MLATIRFAFKKLIHMPRSVILPNFPYCYIDYSKAFDNLKRELCLIVEFIFMFSYLLLFEMPA